MMRTGRDVCGMMTLTSVTRTDTTFPTHGTILHPPVGMQERYTVSFRNYFILDLGALSFWEPVEVEKEGHHSYF